MLQHLSVLTLGLFLPITGRRETLNDKMGLRDMTWGSGAYGEYMTSQTKSPFNYIVTKHFMFGPTKWDYESSAANKAQACAIRPVLVSDDRQEDPIYAPFANIK